MSDRGHDALSRMVVEGYLENLKGWVGDNHWTWNVVETLVDYRPDLAWPMLLEIIRRVPDASLADVAAGPLENILARHGLRVIETVEAEAARNPRLRRALGMVWRQGMSVEVWARVEAAGEAPSQGVSEPEQPWISRRIAVVLNGAPPVGDGGSDDRAAGSALLAAAREAKADGPGAWDTPVALDLRLETGDRPLNVAPSDVMAAVVHALVRGGILADARLVRDARLVDVRSPASGYRLEISLMVEEQVAAMDDVRTLDEWLDAPDTLAFTEELGIEWPRPRD